jgi:hypothetical protein
MQYWDQPDLPITSGAKVRIKLLGDLSDRLICVALNADPHSTKEYVMCAFPFVDLWPGGATAVLVGSFALRASRIALRAVLSP